MSSIESFSGLHETQATICIELAEDLKSKLIALKDSDKVIICWNPNNNLQTEGNYSNTMIYPFESLPIESTDGHNIWLAELNTFLRYDDYEHSSLGLNTARRGKDGSIDYENAQSVYSLNPSNKRIHCHKSGIDKAVGFWDERQALPKMENGRIDLGALFGTDEEQATLIRIILEDALGLLDINT